MLLRLFFISRINHTSSLDLVSNKNNTRNSLTDFVKRFHVFAVGMIWPDVRLEMKSALESGVLKSVESEPVDLSKMPWCIDPMR